MRVILLKDHRHLGQRGDEVDVKPGYGRNFLLPRGFALLANDANRKHFEAMRATEFWSASSELRYGAAAPYALLLVLISVPATLLLVRQGRLQA